MAHENEELLSRFYAAFGRHDGSEMAACYAPGAHFSDPVFTGLSGGEPGAMWKMLTARAEDLEIRLVACSASEETGTAHWLADYTFTQTGRKVHNDVRGTFRFTGGLIAEHRDDFSFYAWARQALGPAGLLLGWTPLVQAKVRGQARESLEQFMADEQKTG